jgi:hypothetical protein
MSRMMRLSGIPVAGNEVKPWGLNAMKKNSSNTEPQRNVLMPSED